jgi:DNA polymerase
MDTDERAEILLNLRELIELDRGFGVEFVALAPSTAQPLAPAIPRAPVVEMAAPVAQVPQRPAPVPETSRPPVATSPAAPPRPAPVAPSQPAPGAPRPADPQPPPRAVPAAETKPQVPAAGPSVPAPSPAGDTLDKIATEIAACRACGLCDLRKKTVPGEGNPRPELLFVGEGPGADEDASGRPFVGAAGQLLDKMIVAMGFARTDVFIANVIKCRPPANRVPEPGEVAACMPYLHRQIALLQPKIICTLGNTPLRALLGADRPGITSCHGQVLSWNGIPLVPTYHPSYLLRNESAKKPCWEDLQVVLKQLGRTPPKRGA